MRRSRSFRSILRPTRALALAALFATPASVLAGTPDIVVTTGQDLVDVSMGATTADLPGTDGLVSFSEALIASNNTAGRQTIGFNVPQVDWTMQGLFPGRLVLETSNDFFWSATDEVTIDGATQTAFTGDTYPNGAEVTAFGGTIRLNAPNCSVFGMESVGLNLNGDNALVQGCTGSTILEFFGCDGGQVGGTGPGEGNSLNVVQIDRAHIVVVVGNVVSRVRVLGFSGGGIFSTGNRIGGPTAAEGNVIRGLGFWDGSGVPSGMAVQLVDTTGTIIQNNMIGLLPDGVTQGAANCAAGVEMTGENNDTLIADNRIAGIYAIFIPPSLGTLRTGTGIVVGGSGAGLDILRNTIGLDINGDPFGALFGIDVGSAIFSTITDIAIEENIVAAQAINGAQVRGHIQGASLRRNLFQECGDLAIDLETAGGAQGLSANDALDADTGGNGQQNFPEIAAALSCASGSRMEYSLGSEPFGEYVVEFFAIEICPANGRGQASVYLGSAPAQTADALGIIAGAAEFPGVTVPTGWFASATATSTLTGSTSEFGPCQEVATWVGCGVTAVQDWLAY